ncbi:hypothetical protein C3K47_14345 [Solitalea longa]|uniref:Amine oxidase domain-containing protein n=1 Tax=Solitalea longa TaxID=2079460 RepID=A0A2S5A0C0_9SPHI|nr:NAD(P)/FAD-dependent oxidoreductase [Solitalea longa]POY35573.1 hypothetical protein C3K47_14345 [Solitalea longa]
MKRRDFIIRTGITAAGLIMAPNHGFQIISKKKPRVVILGAGLAGLTAAHELQKAGVDYIILEANERFGGRIFTKSINGAPIDLGGEWIGFSHFALRNLCDELNLKLTKHHFNTHLAINDKYFAPGSWRLTEVEKQQNNLFSGSGPVSVFSRPNNEMDFKIDGGSSKLIQRLSNLGSASSKIKLNSRVVSVSKNEENYTIACSNGKVYRSTAVICTLPAPVISSIKWRPQLPSEFIESLPISIYQTTLKIPVAFNKAYWRDDNMELLTDKLCTYAYHTSQQRRANVLTFAVSGQNAKDMLRMDPSARINQIVSTLKPVIGKNVLSSIKSVDYYKGLDVSRMFTYAVLDTDNTIECQSFGHLYFCGDYFTSSRGFMEASVQSAKQTMAKLLS